MRKELKIHGRSTLKKLMNEENEWDQKGIKDSWQEYTEKTDE